ncbi:hypothetical protein MMC08_004581 [Hypocenomyce scalaris]|nr:hypothetical protein [Hypocenomyce scalaris]
MPNWTSATGIKIDDSVWCSIEEYYSLGKDPDEIDKLLQAEKIPSPGAEVIELIVVELQNLAVELGVSGVSCVM